MAMTLAVALQPAQALETPSAKLSAGPSVVSPLAKPGCRREQAPVKSLDMSTHSTLLYFRVLSAFRSGLARMIDRNAFA